MTIAIGFTPYVRYQVLSCYSWQVQPVSDITTGFYPLCVVVSLESDLLTGVVYYRYAGGGGGPSAFALIS